MKPQPDSTLGFSSQVPLVLLGAFMPLDTQIRDEVLRYVNGNGAVSLDEFRNWFVPRSWDVEESGNRSAIALAHRIDGILGESSTAGWSEDDIRQELANAIRREMRVEELRIRNPVGSVDIRNVQSASAIGVLVGSRPSSESTSANQPSLRAEVTA